MNSPATKNILVIGLLLFGAYGGASTARAKEMDSFTDRLILIERLQDGTSPLDAHINEKLARAARALTAKKARTTDERNAILSRYFLHPILPDLLCQIEQWILAKAKVPRYELDGRGIYGGEIGYDDMLMAWYVGLAPILRIHGVLIGLDKVGHFFGQGWQYYEEELRLLARTPPLSEASRWEQLKIRGSSFEKAHLGFTNDGVYSVADMAANWQGFRFFRGLFAERDPYLRYDAASGQYSTGRNFTFRDYVTDSWDEVLNPTLARSLSLLEKIGKNMRTPEKQGGTGVCEAYERDPKKFLHAVLAEEPASEYLPKDDLGARRSELAIDVRALCDRKAAATTAPRNVDEAFDAARAFPRPD